MDILGPRMGPSSKMETSGIGESHISGFPKKEPVERPESFSKVLESRRAPQELRPVEKRRSEEREDQAAAVPVKTENKLRRTSERETAMLNFMDSMESEFGITPVRMLEALAVLDTEELTSPPEETASDVINNLGLSPEEAPRVMDLYLGFLQQWRDMPKPDTGEKIPDPAMMAAGLAMAAPAAINTTPTDKRQVLNQSLDRMNDKFFMKAGATQPGGIGIPQDLLAQQSAEAATDASLRRAVTESQLKALAHGQADGQTLAQLNSQLETQSDAGLDSQSQQMLAENSPLANAESSLAGALGFFDGQAPATLAAGALAANALGDDPSLASGKELDLAQATDSSLAKTSDLEALLRQLNADPVALKTEGQVPTNEPKVLDISALQIPGFGGIAAMSGQESVAGGDSGDLEGDTDAQSNGQESEGLKSDFSQLVKTESGSKASGTTTAAAAGTGAFAMTEAESKANLESLKDQTQLMVHKGGGEAKIRLNQEGLGEVHLKVMVNEGRVNIEMKTDNADAKKIIESSIADLRSSLSSQKLSVESVKVDIGQSNLSDSQRGMDFQQDMGRQQARQLMNQFRDESAARRDPFFEMSGIKAYGRKRPDLDPIPPASNTSPRALQGRGERMNIVA